MRKVGQLPAWSIDVPSDMARALGDDDADLYRKAKLFISQGYGIAACAYLRRLVENQIDPILVKLKDVLQTEGASEDEIQKIERAMECGRVTEKLDIVSDVAPATLKVDGTNPLSAIYSQYSDALHNRSEDESKIVAMRLAVATEYVVTELNRTKERRAHFIQTMKNLS
jgi:hypothetical protein